LRDEETQRRVEDKLNGLCFIADTTSGLCTMAFGDDEVGSYESSRPLSDVLVINDNCLWTNDSWRNKNAGLDHIEQKILEIYKHWLWIK
jgi:hypothetical protein